jgi:hypothetical protein
MAKTVARRGIGTIPPAAGILLTLLRDFHNFVILGCRRQELWLSSKLHNNNDVDEGYHVLRSSRSDLV